MAEYIKKALVAREIRKLLRVRESAVDIFQAGFEYGVDKAWANINKIPAADVAPVVHGKWLNFYNDFSCAECDRCGTTFEVTDNESDEELWNEFKLSYNYCPNCGAKMDEEVNET